MRTESRPPITDLRPNLAAGQLLSLVFSLATYGSGKRAGLAAYGRFIGRTAGHKPLLQQSKLAKRPVNKDSLPVNISRIDRAPHPAIVGRLTMIAQDVIMPGCNDNRGITLVVKIFRGNVRLFQQLSVDVYPSLVNTYAIPRQADYTLDVGLARVQGVPEDNNVSTRDRLKPVNELVD